MANALSRRDKAGIDALAVRQYAAGGEAEDGLRLLHRHTPLDRLKALYNTEAGDDYRSARHPSRIVTFVVTPQIAAAALAAIGMKAAALL